MFRYFAASGQLCARLTALQSACDTSDRLCVRPDARFRLESHAQVSHQLQHTLLGQDNVTRRSPNRGRTFGFGYSNYAAFIPSAPLPLGETMDSVGR